MTSDPTLLETFRKQCRSAAGPGLTLLAWREQKGVDQDDLIDIVKEVERERSEQQSKS